jgi:hypothetical protein
VVRGADWTWPFCYNAQIFCYNAQSFYKISQSFSSFRQPFFRMAGMGSRGRSRLAARSGRHVGGRRLDRAHGGAQTGTGWLDRLIGSLGLGDE